MKTIWGAAEQTFWFCNNLYGLYIKMCAALTNYHVGLLPLCCEDGIIERNYYNRMIDEWRRSDAKRKASQKTSMAVKRARMSLSNESAESSGDLDEEDIVRIANEAEAAVAPDREG